MVIHRPDHQRARGWNNGGDPVQNGTTRNQRQIRRQRKNTRKVICSGYHSWCSHQCLLLNWLLNWLSFQFLEWYCKHHDQYNSLHPLNLKLYTNQQILPKVSRQKVQTAEKTIEILFHIRFCLLFVDNCKQYSVYFLSKEQS